MNVDFVPRAADREVAPSAGDAALAQRCAMLEASSRLALKDTTLLRHQRRDDGTVEVEFPSGHRTRHPFAGLTERVRALLDKLPEPADTPPF